MAYKLNEDYRKLSTDELKKILDKANREALTVDDIHKALDPYIINGIETSTIAWQEIKSYKKGSGFYSDLFNADGSVAVKRDVGQAFLYLLRELDADDSEDSDIVGQIIAALCITYFTYRPADNKDIAAINDVMKSTSGGSSFFTYDIFCNSDGKLLVLEPDFDAEARFKETRYLIADVTSGNKDSSSIYQVADFKSLSPDFIVFRYLDLYYTYIAYTPAAPISVLRDAGAVEFANIEGLPNTKIDFRYKDIILDARVDIESVSEDIGATDQHRLIKEIFDKLANLGYDMQYIIKVKTKR